MRKHELTRQEVAQILEDFLNGSGKPWDWDDFTLGTSLENSELEAIRVRVRGLGQEYPPDNPNEYSNEQGLAVLRDYVRQLRNC
jgi:hypothetical protein